MPAEAFCEGGFPLFTTSSFFTKMYIMNNMQEHSLPRQITTFEFKLIGELTIHQFVYLAFGSVLALVLYFAVPAVLYINIAIAALPALLGIGFAFVPINDRPMDIWLRNMIKRLTSPTQYYFKKNNAPPKIMLGITLPPRDVLQQHLLAQQKLNTYLQNKPRATPKEDMDVIDKAYDEKKKKLQAVMMGTSVTSHESRVVSPEPGTLSLEPKTPVLPLTDQQDIQTLRQSDTKSVDPRPATRDTQPVTTDPRPVTSDPRPATRDPQPSTSFVVRGEVYAGTGLPLEGILAYVKQGDKIVRLFRTDAHGVFVNNLPIPKGDYVLNLEDPRKIYSFDTMKIDGTLPNIVVFAHKQS